MTPPAQPEAWLRGPVEGVSPWLMPAAHALIHAREDAALALHGLAPSEIWRNAGAASVGFHIRHLCGALDRLLTYARGEALSEQQRRAVASEKQPGDPPADGATLLQEVDETVERALAAIRSLPAEGLLQPRGVGRQQLPSNVLGLVFHAAEHAARHAGQAITTARLMQTR